MKLISFVFAITCFTMACNNGAQQTTQEQQATDEVMRVHDEVMPKMGDVNRMTTDLRNRAAGLDSTQMALKNELYDAIQSLERADEGMMNWMAAFQMPESLRGEGKTHEEIMRYLEAQQTMVNQVRDSIQQSLQRGEQLMQQAPAATPDTMNQQ